MDILLEVYGSMINYFYYADDLIWKRIFYHQDFVSISINYRHFRSKIILLHVGDAMSSGDKILVYDENRTTHTTEVIPIEFLKGHAKALDFIFMSKTFTMFL